jgi:RNA polymerase sigma-70 factor (TIGR02943 family)
MYQSDPAIVIKSWVEKFSDKMYSWAFYKTNSKETAEDLVQDTFLAAYQSLEKFEGKSNPKTWLFGILNNKIADHFRKSYRNTAINESDSKQNSSSSFFESFFDTDGKWLKEQQPHDWADEGVNLLDDEVFIKVLQACMNNLPSSWFSAIQLRYLEEKKGDLICQELKITNTNFWQILHRAKLQLRKCLELNWFKK